MTSSSSCARASTGYVCRSPISQQEKQTEDETGGLPLAEKYDRASSPWAAVGLLRRRRQVVRA